MANINNFEQFQIEFTRANSLNKAKLAMQYPDYINRMLRIQLDIEGKIPGQGTVEELKNRADQVKDNITNKAKEIKQDVTQKANTVKTNITNQTKIAQQKLNQALTKEGLKKATTVTPKVASTAKNIFKGGANVAKKAAGGVIAGALDIPTTIGNWTREGANTLSRGLDVAGNAMTIAAPYALKIPGWRGKVASGLLLGGGQGVHYLSDKLIDNNQQQPTLTTQEILEAGRLANQEANDLQTQAKNQLNLTQDAIDWYNNFDNRMSPGNYSPSPTIQELNMRLPAPPTTGVNTLGNTNRPISNLTPVPGQSDASNQNQTGNINMSNQQPIQYQPTNNDMANLMNNIQLLNSYIGGVQRGNVLPNLGVSNEELQTYSNALRQYGENVSRARADVEAYRDALNRSNKMQAVAGVLNGLGQAASGFFPGQSMASVVPGLGYINPGRTQGVNLNNLGQSLVNAADRQLQNVQTNLVLNNQLRQQEENRAAQFADLLTAARVSNATGLPLNVARQMTPENYLNYIKPVQEVQNKAQEIALQGVSDLITGKQQQGADYAKALDTQALENQAAYQREALSQLGQNQRAQLNALVTTEVANLNNDTKLKLMQMTGMNQQQLERLRQSDPNAYLRAIGPVLMASAYFTGPAAQAGQFATYQILQNLINPSGVQQPAAQSYWAQFNQ